MVVICAGTTGYSTMVDLRYHWVRQKRLQKSHGSNDEQARAYNQLVCDGKIDPCLGKVYTFEDIGKAHYDMEQRKMVKEIWCVTAPYAMFGARSLSIPLSFHLYILSK